MDPDSSAPPGWYALLSSAIFTPVFNRERAVFTNRTLRLDRIGAVGFDLDHTLAVYNRPALDELAMRLVIDRLIAEEGLPASHFDTLPDAQFARKALIIDIKLGNVLKVDRYGHVAMAYHGIERLASADKRRTYGDMDVIPHVTDGDRFVQADTSFANPEILIYAAVIPRLDPQRRPKLWKTIRYHSDMVHRDGSLKEKIVANPLAYLEPDPDTVSFLRRLRDDGKKLFLLTNSEREYTRAIAPVVLGLPPDAPEEDWLSFFDLTIVEARKPAYFKPRTKAGEVLAPTLIRGGNLSDLEDRIGISGPEVLYVGDHIYSDLITSKRRSSWRTMLVIHELEEEVLAQSVLPGMVEQLKQTDERRTETEREVQHWKAVGAALQAVTDSEHQALVARLTERLTRSRDQATRALKQFIKQREDLRNEIARATNQFWGSLFRAGSELTYYGRQVEDFACIYSSRATNLALYPGDHYFRSAMDYLPHEIEGM